MSSNGAAPPPPPSKLPAFQPTTANDLQLSFNKAHFSRTDFDLERFLSLTRRRVTLDQLYTDLKVYLKVVQNSMIELINDDYADFVNLSSNLVSLKDSIDKVGSDINNNFAELCQSTVDVQRTANIVEEKFQEMAVNHKEQTRIRNRISLVVSLKSLSGTLSKKPAELNHRWLDSLACDVVAVEHWFQRNEEVDDRFREAREQCWNKVQNCLSYFISDNLKNEANYVAPILSILLLINRTERAAKTIGEDVIGPLMVVKDGEELDRTLENALDLITSLQAKWTDTLGLSGHATSKVLLFLDQCLLYRLSDFLDKNFGAVLVPSNNRLFHRCYSKTAKFIESFRKFSATAPLLRKIRDKFNLIVYFKLETQHFIVDLNTQTAVDKFSYLLDSAENENRLTPASATVFTALRNCYADDVYLDSLADKFWDFTLKIIIKYGEWIDVMTRRFGQSKANDLQCGSETWKCVVALSGDVLKTDEDLFDFVTTVIYRCVKDLGQNTTIFGQCITLFSNELSAKRSELEKILIRLIMDWLDKQLEGVLDIPRQYRWTKKPAPTECSTYMSEAFDFLWQFDSFAAKSHWDEDSRTSVVTTVVGDSMSTFYKKAEQVLSTVEQTGSSLQRFKRKAQVTAANEELPQSSSTSNLESDEGKIRAQLRLDIDFFCHKAAHNNPNINFEIFDNILNRL